MDRQTDGRTDGVTEIFFEILQMTPCGVYYTSSSIQYRAKAVGYTRRSFLFLYKILFSNKKIINYK